MPGGGGIKVAKTCGEQTRIVMLTVSEAERDLLDAVAAGAVGYLVKSTPPEELRQGLWRAAQGEPVFSPSLASLVLGEFRRLAKASGPVQPLSDREREVLQYVARGHTYREIGEQLFIAEKTVENHVRNILGKLHLNRSRSSSATPWSTASSSPHNVCGRWRTDSERERPEMLSGVRGRRPRTRPGRSCQRASRRWRRPPGATSGRRRAWRRPRRTEAFPARSARWS